MSHMFWIAYAYVIGLCFGSFANVVIYRLPQKQSIAIPPSHCPLCKHYLKVSDLLPIISWLTLQGRCRYCKKHINPRYPIIEIICASLFASMTFYTESLSAVPLSVLAFVLICVSVIDWDTKKIPDELLLLGTVTGVAWIGAGYIAPDSFSHAPNWLDALLGVAVGALPLLILDGVTLLLLKKDGFGYGDVKLMGMLGIWLGWRYTLLVLFFAFILGGAYGAFLLITRRIERGGYLAFGPFLCTGALISLWFGEVFLNNFL